MTLKRGERDLRGCAPCEERFNKFRESTSPYKGYYPGNCPRWKPIKKQVQEAVQVLEISRRMTDLAKLILLLCFVEANSLFPIRMYRDFTYPTVDSFNVYWNAPTYLCRKYNIDFEPELKKFGIIGNKNDSFRGEQIVILYDPGLFPAMIQDTATGKLKERNGGIPQLGKIDVHLDEFTTVIEKVVPEDFGGVGIIDFEAWRPVFRQNWNDQVIYKNKSISYERQKHPQWNEKQILSAAKSNFEESSRVFMEVTLKLAKTLRPNARWGYYGFPYCFNCGKESSAHCPVIVQKENNEIQWLFDESTAFYPSVYSSSKLTTDQHRLFVIGRLNEAWRMSSRASRSNPPHVYPYVWYRYHDNSNFLTKDNMYDALEMTRRYRMGGVIIWGSSYDLKTQEKCQKLLDYVNTVLGPVVLRVKQNRYADVQDDGIIIDESSDWYEGTDYDTDMVDEEADLMKLVE